ncbi:MAG: non-canonical purine NTP pyrophosphatase [Thiolinea sp.]
MMKLVLATGNAGKYEVGALLADLALEVVPQSSLGVDEAEETGLSFVENALLKARHAARQTGLPALADDSGLVVDALHGQPGIYSAHYAGHSG